MPYASDPVTWDGLATSRAADTDAIINTYDGLMEYDVEELCSRHWQNPMKYLMTD